MTRSRKCLLAGCVVFLLFAAGNDLARTQSLEDFNSRRMNDIVRQIDKNADRLSTLENRTAILETIAETQTWWFRAIGVAIVGLLFKDFRRAKS